MHSAACMDIQDYLLRLVGLYDPSQFPLAVKDFPVRWKQAGKHSQVRAWFWTQGQKSPQLLPPCNMQTQVFSEDLKHKPSSVNCSTAPSPMSSLCSPHITCCWHKVVFQLHITVTSETNPPLKICIGKNPWYTVYKRNGYNALWWHNIYSELAQPSTYAERVSQRRFS